MNILRTKKKIRRMVAVGVCVLFTGLQVPAQVAHAEGLGDTSASTSLPSAAIVAAEQEADAAQIAAIQAKLGSLVAAGKVSRAADPKAGGRGLSATASSGSSSNGTYGDIWVSLFASSGSIGFAGHAAIVSNTATKTVESFAKSFSPINKDGVQWYSNTWGSRLKVLMLRPEGATIAKYKAAATYAQNQVGDPYNWNFANKMTETSFYCSQLVWRAWLKQGINIETGSFPNVAVTPADLVNSTNTWIVISR